MSSEGPTLEILSKFDMRDLKLKNRVVMAPMTRARCDPTPDDFFDIKNSLPNERMKEYYAQRASAGLVITEGTQISVEARGWMCAPDIRSDEHAEAWKPVVDAVHEKGGIFFCQLWHLGRQAHSSFHPDTKDIVAPSAIKIVNGQAKHVSGEKVEWETPRAMSVEDVKATVQDFVKAAAFAKKAGFDGVEIHSANGYVIDEFLQSSTNQRTDQYGGSMENRVRILQEVVEGMLEEGSYPASRIGFRLSPNGVFGDMGSDDNHLMFPFVAQTMNKYGLAYMHVMDGLGFGFHNKSPPVRLTDMRKHFDGPIISNVCLTKEMAEGVVRSGAADLVAFGRPYIANPDLVERFANNWPLAETPPHDLWWNSAKGEEGYSAYEPYHEEKKD